MIPPFRLTPRAWWLLPLFALVVLVSCDARRIQRVLSVTALGGEAPASDVRSSSGYAGGVRQLVVPDRNPESLQWIAQTQQMFSRGEWRVRHTDADNAPEGREVRNASPYRWWLGTVAWCDHAISGRPLGQSVEHAALFADSLLRVLFFLGTVAFVARYFGAAAASLVSIAWVGLFPFSTAFLPGLPDSFGFSQGVALWSVLLLVTGMNVAPRSKGAAPVPFQPERPPAGERRWFVLAGVAGGWGLWMSVRIEMPIVIGLSLGGLAAAFAGRPARAATKGSAVPTSTQIGRPWLAWGLAGAGTTLLAWILDYAPAHLELSRLETVHPLYAVSWVGLAWLTAQLESWIRTGIRPHGVRRWATLACASCLAASLPLMMFGSGKAGFVAPTTLASRLSLLPDSPLADSVIDWLSRDGLSAAWVVTLLPALLAVLSGWIVLRQETTAERRAALLVALAPALVFLPFACLRLRDWNGFDAMLVPLLAVAAPGAIALSSRSTKAGWFAAAFACLLPGIFLLLPAPRRGEEETLTEADVEALVERDFAQWLANRMGKPGAVVLASPTLTSSLSYFGGVRGLTTPYWENQDGFRAAMRIGAATLPDEAQALARRRSLTHIVLASWSPELSDMARVGSNGNEHTLIRQLEDWMPPRWLRPVVYDLPKISGFEGQSLAVFEVVDVQDNVTALARLAEYFAETDQMPLALAVVGTLIHQFPTDPSAAAARAQVALLRRDREDFVEALRTITAPAALDQAAELPWDRRVSLALVLAQGEQLDAARTMAQACLAQVDEAQLRSVSTASLFRFLALTKALGMEFADPQTRNRALSLLPPESRTAL
ncbi:hypothetical protein DB347_02490 [Opitutaceae bacterium EW11]|nr:hypothetical protein DB347_02490 [Opitutaceae bacterium EW11]